MGEPVAGLVASGHHLQGAAGQSGPGVDVGQQQRSQGAGVGRLEDHGVAGQERRRSGAGHQRHREVEGGDDRPHSPGAQHRMVGVPHPVGAHGRFHPPGLVQAVAVVVGEGHRLGDVPQRLEPVLPDLQAQEAGQRGGLLVHEVGRPPDDGYALLPRGPLPLGLEGAGRRHGIVHILVGGLGVDAHHQVGVDRGAFGVGLGGVPLLTVDQEGMGLPDLARGSGQALLVGLMECRVVGRHRGIGDLSHGVFSFEQIAGRGAPKI